jgi:DNA-binding transcriptional MerR regulator
METISIGEAAKLLGVNTSALRYYEERGLVHPARRAGTRVYAKQDLRRLAFVQLFHQLGLPLSTAKAILDSPGQEWRNDAKAQVDELAELIHQAQAAQDFLTHAVKCPAEHPVDECPVMMSGLDERLTGAAPPTAG